MIAYDDIQNLIFYQTKQPTSLINLSNGLTLINEIN